MRKRLNLKWVVIAILVVGVAALLLLAPAKNHASITFSPALPLPMGNATTIPFKFIGARLFWTNGNTNMVEVITGGITIVETMSLGFTTNHHLIPTGVPSGPIPLSKLETLIDVVIPEGTKQFRAKYTYLEPSPAVSARLSLSLRHPGLARWIRLISRPFERPSEFREVRSPWLVKTNGMWVEQP